MEEDFAGTAFLLPVIDKVTSRIAAPNTISVIKNPA
jgi:hypothetical protein